MKNVQKFKPKKKIMAILDPLENNEELLVKTLFDIIVKSKSFKIGKCENLIKSVDDAIVYYSIDRNSEIFKEQSLKKPIFDKLYSSPRLAAVYSLIITKNKLPTKIHDKIAEYAVKHGTSVQKIIRNNKDYKDDKFNFIVECVFDEFESDAYELYLYKYMNFKSK